MVLPQDSHYEVFSKICPLNFVKTTLEGFKMIFNTLQNLLNSIFKIV